MELYADEKFYVFCPACKTELIQKLVDRRKKLGCPHCDFIFWNNPKPVVSIVLHDGEKVLMLERASEPLKGYWCLPGGFVDREETPENAVLREVKEEVGVALDSVDGLIGLFRIRDDPRGVHLDIIYEKKISLKTVILSPEHGRFQFFSPDNLPARIAYMHREAIEMWRIRQD